MPEIIRSDVYSVNGVFGVASSSGTPVNQQFDFGLVASGLIVLNTCNGRLFYNLTGGPATTGMAYIACGDKLEVWPPGFRTCGLGLTSTSTSTATYEPSRVKTGGSGGGR